MKKGIVIFLSIVITSIFLSDYVFSQEKPAASGATYIDITHAKTKIVELTELKQKLTNTNTQLSDQNATSKTKISQHEQYIQKLSTLVDKLEVERKKVTEIIEKDVKDFVITKNAQNTLNELNSNISKLNDKKSESKNMILNFQENIKYNEETINSNNLLIKGCDEKIIVLNESIKRTEEQKNNIETILKTSDGISKEVGDTLNMNPTAGGKEK